MQIASFRITRFSGVLLLLILLTAAFVEVTAHAQSYEDLPPELEERAQSLYASLLCPQCAGQTIAQSSAPVASAMRRVIRDQLLAGATDDAIVTALVSAYGEGVLASPPVRGFSLTAWLVPPIAILLGAIAVVFAVRSLRRESLHGVETATGTPETGSSPAERLRFDLVDQELGADALRTEKGPDG